ncbi:ribosomal protein S15 [Chloropicon roscoffensis]|uniref:30S ribosomal protein S15 n=2 Tax=Chloropicon roscoffensis TaxID=1461544 RepID=A0AAX4PMP9_9CHLO
MKCIARGGTCTARKACATRATRARIAPTSHSRVSSNVACRAARGTYNTDYAGVEDFMRHDKDVGSSEYQIARISTRIKQLTEHLKEHKTDHATRRGLMSLLNKRNTLLKYLFNNDRKTYTATIESLGIRSRLADEL